MSSQEQVVLSEKKSRLNQWMKWISGCGLFCMGALALLLGGLYYINHDQQNVLQRELDVHIANGFPLIRQDVIEIKEPLAGKRLLNANEVILTADCPDGLVIYANSCRIDAPLTGAVIFKVNRLVLGEKAVLAAASGDVYEFINHGAITKNNLVVHKKP